MRVCILIPTYKRNESLIRLLHQLSECMSTYRGPLSLEVCVTDSEGNNPKRQEIEQLCDRYLVNPGIGFDSNMYSAYEKVIPTCDFVFSASDDDLLAKGFAHPLDILEVAIRQDRDAVLFDHFEYKAGPDPQTYILQAGPYSRPAIFEEGCSGFQTMMSFYIPRHTGLLYKSSYLQEIYGKLEGFLGSFHLYAVPFHLSQQKGTAHFFAYPLMYFNTDQKDDGAWENRRAVFEGLLKYFLTSQKVLNPDNFAKMKPYFMQAYLKDKSSMRPVGDRQLPTEAEILAMVE